MEIRAATDADLEAIGRIQQASPGASQWDPAEYLDYDCIVAVSNGQVAGFLVSRNLADEREILNVAVGPEFRRQGVGAALLGSELTTTARAWFLEVRESNTVAQSLYRKAGFRETGRRPRYYSDPPESAIVLTFFS